MCCAVQQLLLLPCMAGCKKRKLPPLQRAGGGGWRAPAWLPTTGPAPLPGSLAAAASSGGAAAVGTLGKFPLAGGGQAPHFDEAWGQVLLHLTLHLLARLVHHCRQAGKGIEAQMGRSGWWRRQRVGRAVGWSFRQPAGDEHKSGQC